MAIVQRMRTYCFQDMEKWAKKLNAQKEHLREEVKPPVAEPIIDIASVSLPSSAAADAGFSMLEKVSWQLASIWT